MVEACAEPAIGSKSNLCLEQTNEKGKATYVLSRPKTWDWMNIKTCGTNKNSKLDVYIRFLKDFDFFSHFGKAKTV